eukprot:72020-Alexandrium_andersonii.AAC.1
MWERRGEGVELAGTWRSERGQARASWSEWEHHGRKWDGVPDGRTTATECGFFIHLALGVLQLNSPNPQS